MSILLLPRFNSKARQGLQLLTYLQGGHKTLSCDDGEALKSSLKAHLP